MQLLLSIYSVHVLQTKHLQLTQRLTTSELCHLFNYYEDGQPMKDISGLVVQPITESEMQHFLTILDQLSPSLLKCVHNKAIKCTRFHPTLFYIPPHTRRPVSWKRKSHGLDLSIQQLEKRLLSKRRRQHNL